MTRASRTTVHSGANCDWQKAYELDSDGNRTGRWQWLNESGERDEFYPGHWLDAGDVCPPPAAISRAEGRSDE